MFATKWLVLRKLSDMSKFLLFTTKWLVSFSLATEGFLLQSDREARAWGGIASESSQLIFVNLEIFNLIAANGNHILESLKKKHIDMCVKHNTFEKLGNPFEGGDQFA